jgi:glucosamine--fructose-6-phosphate aminotransferase (isomerizing)
VEVYTFGGDRLKKHPFTLNWNPIMVEKQGFKHFMLKEIYEQPGVVRTCLETYLDTAWTAASDAAPVQLNLPDEVLNGLERVQVVACGTSWHASLVGKYLIEQLAGIPTMVQYASEFRYSPSPLTPHTLTIGVTQSGETADTLAALEMEQTRRRRLGKRPWPPHVGHHQSPRKLPVAAGPPHYRHPRRYRNWRRRHQNLHRPGDGLLLPGPGSGLSTRYGYGDP